MIMKKVSLLLCLFLGTLSVSAQTWGSSTEAGRKATFARNGFWDNWFIGAGAGASVYFGAADQHASFTDRMTVNPSAFVGKWYNPYFGFRGRLQGGKLHMFSGTEAQKMYSRTYFNAHADFMFNATNYFLKYDENRFYNFIPTVGVGYIHGDWHHKLLKKKGFDGVTVNASLLNTFRITNKLSAFIEVGGAFVNSEFDASPRGDKATNGFLTGTAGLMLKVGKSGFQEAVLMDQNLIDELNGRINRLKAENDQLRNQRPDCPPVVQPNCPPVNEVVATNLTNVVFFRLNSAAIDANQQASILTTAKYLQDNPNAKVKIVGYADKQTGTAAYNLKLSERRAKNVADALIKKHGISSDRLKVEFKGSSEQPYKENAWNRVAIFFAE